MNFGEPECTSKCRSTKHGTKIVSALTKHNEEEVLSYIRQTCCNLVHVTDEFGRNSQHMAASCGRARILEWLLQNDSSDRNVKDGESGWTPLHRSIFYGQLSAARLLIMHGSSLQVQDHEGYTPLDLIMKDRLPYVEYSAVGPCEVYVWGSNTNFNLGHENQQSKVAPELIEAFKREKISIKQVIMCKYHTIFLSHDGKPFTCGHGHGGRLGHGSEQTCLTPKPIKVLASENCIQVAGGTDHSVFLTSSGAVWTCGLNSYQQLGHSPPPDRQLTPKLIKYFQQKGVNVTGVCAARFHTVAYTKDAVFTFGLNAGQLGHLKSDKAECNPRQVSALNLRDTEIVSVAASDGATVCMTNKGDIYVLHEFQCRKIASKLMDISSMSAVGGHLDAKCYPLVLKEKGGVELKIMLLTNSGKLSLWTESYPQLCRCLFSLRRQLFVKDFALNQSSLALISEYGEGFVGFLTQKKMGDGVEANSHKKEKKGKELHGSEHFMTENDNLSFSVKSHKASIAFTDFVDKEECHIIKVERLPHIHRGIAAACDPMGRNFAVLQGHPSNSVLENPCIQVSESNQHFASLLEEADVYDKLHDLTFKVGIQEFPVHKYILLSRADYFKKIIKEQDEYEGVIKLDNVQAEIFKQILKYIYSQTCDFLKVGYKFTQLINEKGKNNNNESTDAFLTNDYDPHSKSAFAMMGNHKRNNSKNNQNNKIHEMNPLKLLQEMAKKIGLKSLMQQLENVKHSNNKIIYVPTTSKKQIKFDRKKFPELYDLIIESEDGIELPCHKCVLVARSEYFRSMFGNTWIETTANRSIRIPVTADVLEIVIDYLYTDDVTKLDRFDDADFVCRILVVADQLLIIRLKSICEKSLANMISLKNGAELMQFAFTYQAEQLQNVCMEFICLNLMAILENKSLSVVSDEAMEALTKTYREMIPAMQYRCITPYLSEPTYEDIKLVASQHPSAFEDIDSSFEQNKLDSSYRKNKSKRKPRTRKSSGNENRINEFHRCESFCSMTSDHHSDIEEISSSPSPDKCDDLVSSPENSMLNLSSPISIPKSQEVNDSKRTLVRSSSPILESELQPWNGRKRHEDNLDLKTIMMQQKEEMKQSLHANVKSVSAHKKTQKLSQKQRKRLSSGSISTDNKIVSPTSSPVATGLSPSVINPWGEISKATLSLKEIMNDEISASHSKQIQDSNRKFLPQEQQSRHYLASSPPNLNPWTKETATKEAFCVEKFSDILLDEQKQKNVPPIKTKALDLIQMEDAAIEELLKFYNAASNPDERVRVERILPHLTTAPAWKGRDKKSPHH